MRTLKYCLLLGTASLVMFVEGAAAQLRETVLEGERLVPYAQASRGRVVAQSMKKHGKGWSRGAQLLWTAPSAKQRLRVRFYVRNGGESKLSGLFTQGPGYADFKAWVNGKASDVAFAGNHASVRSSGAVEIGTFKLQPGMNTLELRLTGAAKGKLLLGLDALAVFPVSKWPGIRDHMDERYQAWLTRHPSPDGGGGSEEEEENL